MRLLGPPDPDRGTAPARRGLIPAALGAAGGVSALSWASQQAPAQQTTVATWAVPGIVALVALAVLVPSMRRLLPTGVFRARRGIATVVASRGILAGAFFTMNSYLPLLLTSVHGWSLAMAGVPLLVGSLGWSAASFWQGRHPDLPRRRLLRIGLALLTIGTAGLLLVAPTWGVAWLVLPFWVVAGVGMGLGFSSMSYLLLQQSAPAEIGFNSAAAQMADQLTTATMIGAGGALLVLLAPPALALTVLVAVLACLAGLGVAIAGRTVGHPEQAATPPAPHSPR
jgi:predicted MFS family arabinose efflux permease